MVTIGFFLIFNRVKIKVGKYTINIQNLREFLARF